MFIGSRAKDMWSEIWDVVGPLAQHVLDTGEGTWNEDLPLFMQRKGYLEETYFSFSYSPARDEHGLIQGIFCACQETTDRVLHERRLNTLRELSVKKFHSEWEAAQEFAQALSNNSWDITFLLILLKDRNTGRVLIRDGFGIDIQKASERLRDVVFSFESPTLITGLREKYFDFLPSDPWPEKSNSAYIMPMDGFGYLVYGVSPRLEFNTSYEGFLELASQSITNGFREVERERIILDNEERLNLVFKSSEIGFWDWDYKTGEVLVNEQFKHDWGIETQGNLTNQNEIYVKIHPDDLEKIRSEFASAQRENRNYEVEYRILRTPQEILWIYAKGKIYFDQEGVPARMTGTSVNVTPQRKLNDALKTSENEFRSLVESLPGIVWISDSSGKVTWYNRNWYEYTGLKFEESWEKVVHPEDILSLKEKTGTTQFEYRIRRESDGMYRWHVGRSIPIRDADGLVIRQIGASFDIHDRVESQKLLARRNELFQLITETIPQGIWRTNPDGSADYFSKRFGEMLGRPVEELLGWGWASLIHPDDQPAVMAEWQRCLSLSIGVSWEFRVRQANGKYRWYLSLGNPFRDERGEIIKYYGTWTDIDDQKNTQEMLSQALKARDEFVSVASHELKTPLTSLKLQTQMHKRLMEKNNHDAYTKEQVNKLIDQTDQQVKRLTRLVDDMLDISRIRTGKLQINKQKIDLCHLIYEVIERMRPQFPTVEHVVLNCPTSLELLIDPMRFEQVLTNLLTNALKYGREKPVYVDFQDHADHVVLQVRDEGLGITAIDLERIFGRFERAVSANEVAGLGLGLYITKQIVLAHGGEIWVESEIGKGSTFFVKFPK